MLQYCLVIILLLHQNHFASWVLDSDRMVIMNKPCLSCNIIIKQAQENYKSKGKFRRYRAIHALDDVTTKRMLALATPNFPNRDHHRHKANRRPHRPPLQLTRWKSCSFLTRSALSIKRLISVCSSLSFSRSETSL